MEDNSYNNYRKYRANRHGYKMNQIAMPIAVIIIIALLTKFWWLLILIALTIVTISIVNKILGLPHLLRVVAFLKFKSNILQDNLKQK